MDDIQSTEPKLYPGVVVQLTGGDGNAFSIIAAVTRALRIDGASPDEISDYTRAATAGSYDDLLRTTMRWVDVR